MKLKICVICGKQFYGSKNKRCCSKKCSSELRNKTNLQKYGFTNVCELQKPKEKICKICGKSFIATNNNSKYCEECKKPINKICKLCHKEFIDKSINKDRIYCNSCSIKLSNKEKYDVDNVFQLESTKEKSKQTMLNRYNVDHPMHSDVIRQKLKDTNKQKYNVSYSFQSDIVKQKSKDTINQKYGVDNIQQIPGIQDKKKQTILNTFGTWNNYKQEMVKKVKNTKKKRYDNENYCNREKYKQTMIYNYGPDYASFLSPLKGTHQPEEMKIKRKITCYKKYGVPYSCMTPQCRLKGKAISKVNIDFGNKLKVLGLNPIYEKCIENKSYDIFIKPNTVIEIDPTFTHNINNRKNRLYHYEKTMIANKNGYKCIHIFDWDDKTKVLNLLKEKQKIYARKCNIKNITKKECNEFLNRYHLQNTCRGQLIRLGLCLDNTLIQVMTFGKPRYNKNYQWELLRLCSVDEYQVIGGTKKLFNYFIKTYKPKSIISYCDIAKFTGEVYEKLGFQLYKTTKPNKHWSKYKEHITDNLLRAKGYDQLFGTCYGKGTSNEELMLENKWLPVYDCGQYVFIKTFN